MILRFIREDSTWVVWWVWW